MSGPTPFSCGNCGQRFGTKGDKRRHKANCNRAALPDEDDDQDAYSFVPKPSQRIIEEAAREWAELEALGSDPVMIQKWVREGIKADLARERKSA